MKISILAILIFGTISFTSANYTIQVPLEKGNGGTLPNGSINIIPMNQAEEWLPTTPNFTNWVNINSPYDCTEWGPNPSGITVGVSYTQTANDCKQEQTRTRQEREQETTTLSYRDVGLPITENQVITTTDTRNAVGTMESWIDTDPVYTTWINSGVLYGCSNWSPAPSTVNSGVSFTQTATDCSQNQTRDRQNREQETTTLAIRNNGSVIVENQTLTNMNNTRSAIGTKVNKVCAYTDQEFTMNFTGDSMYHYTVNGSVIGSSSNGTPVVINGIIYSVGSYVRRQILFGSNYTYYYETCKEPL